MGQKNLCRGFVGHNPRTLRASEHLSAAARGAKILQMEEVLVEGQPKPEMDSPLMLLVAARMLEGFRSPYCTLYR